MFISDVHKISLARTIRNIFRVHEGEGKKMTLLWIAMFSAVTANFLVWSVIQSTFIKRVGVEHLPYLYLGSSAAVLVGSLAYAWGITLYKKTTVMHLFTVVSVISIVAAFALIEYTALIPLYFILAILGNSAFLSFISSQLWNVINDVFSTSQAKRLFPLLGISGTVAGMVAGALLQWVTPLVGTESMLVIGVVFLLGASPAVAAFHRLYAKDLDWYLAVKNVKETSGGAIRDVVNYVFRSKFILALAGVVMLHWFFNRLFGFVFAEVADQAFSTEDAFTQFSGLYLLAVCVGGILFDTLFLNRLLEKVGLTRGMFLVSNVVTVLAIGILAFPLFPVVIGAYYLRDILLSVQLNSVQVMTGIVPDEHRPKVTSFLDGAVVTIGGGVGSLLVLGVSMLIPASTPLETEIRVLALCILFLLIIRFILNFYLRREFFRILEDHLRYGDLKTKQRAIETLVEHKYLKRDGMGKLIDTLKDPSEPLSVKESVVRVLGQITDPTTMRVLIHQLESTESPLRLAAARALSEFHLSPKQFYEVAFSRHHAIEALRALFEREQDAVIRAAALDALIHLEDPDIVTFLLLLLQKGDETTRADCVHSLRLFHDTAMTDDVRRVLQEKSPVIRSYAIIALWQFPWERERLKLHLMKMLKTKTEAAFARLTPSAREEFRIGLKTLGEIGLLEMKPLLHDGLSWSGAPEIQTECALSLFKMGDPLGQEQIRKVLEGEDLVEIRRIRLIAATRVLDGKAGAILTELIEETRLEYPPDVPSGESLDRPMGTIPAPCLQKLLELYRSVNDHEELGKIHTFLKRKEGSKRVRGTVILIEPDLRLERMYMIALLAHGYDVKTDTRLPGTEDAKTAVAIVLDEGGAIMPDLSHVSEDIKKRSIVILGRSEESVRSDIARVERKTGVVFRHHFAPSELIAEVEKKR